MVKSLGYDVVTSDADSADLGAVIAQERPDVALIGIGENSDRALQLIAAIVRGAFCPVIAVLETYDAEWLDDAAQRGVYAYIVDTRLEEFRSAIGIALQRFDEFQTAQGAFDRPNADIRREDGQARARERNALELYDGVYQELVIARLALDLELPTKSREALLSALESAAAIINRSVSDLRKDGVPLSELIKDAAPA
jgi:signal transduction histidine kinase